MKKTDFLPVLILACFLPLLSFSQIRLPSFFGDHMVLQQQEDVHLWGWDQPGQKVVIRTDWGGSASARADQNGKWETSIQTPSAGGPYQLRFSGSDEVVLNDVMTGEVWICSGQSNMVMTLRSTYRHQPTHLGSEAILKAGKSNIRVYTAKTEASLKPLDDMTGKWKPSTPANAADFSAVAWFFGRYLEEVLDVPVGLIITAWGGSRIEAWMDEETLRKSGVTEFPEEIPEKAPHHAPTLLHNAMLKPLAPFTARGFLWYQGESNVSDAGEYSTLFANMIESWREDFGKPEMPFYFAEIAPYNYGDHNSALLREAQSEIMKNISHTGMASTIDLGNCTNIHPGDKKDVGRRLALWALARTYGLEGFQYSGPVFKEMKPAEGHKFLLTFDHTAHGFSTFGEPLLGFEISNSEGNFVPAEAQISGSGIMVWSEKVKNPKAVRYAFSNCPEATLYNMDRLPAPSFRTDRE